MSKYNVGDVVKLRDDLEVGKVYGRINFATKMEKLKNKPVEILYREFQGDYIVQKGWIINDEMIEGLWEEKQVTMKYKIGDRFRYKDGYNTYRIISCDEEAGKYITVEEKQVCSRVFDVCEEKNMFLEECKEKQDKLKLIDVLNMIAKRELKEGTKVRYEDVEYTYKKFDAEDDESEDLISDSNCSIFEDYFLTILEDEVELIEPPCEHEWKDIETHRMGEGIIRRFRRCNKCGLEEVTEKCDVEADKTIEPTKIEELGFNKLLTTEGNVMSIINKLNEVINKVNAQTEVILAQRKDIYEIKEQLDY